MFFFLTSFSHIISEVVPLLFIEGKEASHTMRLIWIMYIHNTPTAELTSRLNSATHGFLVI